MRAYISPKKCDLDFEKQSIFVEVMIFFTQWPQAIIHTLECGINILSINEMKPKDLTELAETLGLEKINQKSGVNLRNEINYLIKIFLAGQVPLLTCTQTIFKTFLLKYYSSLC